MQWVSYTLLIILITAHIFFTCVWFRFCFYAWFYFCFFLLSWELASFFVFVFSLDVWFCFYLCVCIWFLLLFFTTPLIFLLFSLVLFGFVFSFTFTFTFAFFLTYFFSCLWSQELVLRWSCLLVVLLVVLTIAGRVLLLPLVLFVWLLFLCLSYRDCLWAYVISCPSVEFHVL